MWSQAVAQTGTVSGILQNDHAAGVANAFVTAKHEGSAEFNGFAQTASDGSFILTSVPPGVYHLCIQAPVTALLNPCQWSATLPTATVGAGQAVRLGVIQLKTGYPLMIQLNDDTGDFNKNNGKPGAHILLGVWDTSGVFVPARLKGKDSKTHYYEVIVPYDQRLKFSIQSNFYRLGDMDGAAVNPVRGSQMDIIIPSGTNSLPIVYHVNGVKP